MTIRILRIAAVAALLCATALSTPPSRPAGAGGRPQSSARVPAVGGWRQASPGYAFAFPRDHASHPEYRIEWWYYTGNLSDEAGRLYGYQLTFFRIGVDPKPSNPSVWAVRDLFIAHLAVSELSQKRFRFAERVNRRGPGWAGALADRYRVWNGDWEASLDPRGRHRLSAADGRIGLSLTLEPTRAAVLHGVGGYSRKGAGEGNASHYYSLTRLHSEGELTLDGRKVPVRGLSWMDHEFGTSFLEPGQVGWDWFSIQLDDGTDLMLFQLRRADGSRDPRSSGTFVEAGGRPLGIRVEDFRLTPETSWESADSGAKYPVRWDLGIPQLDIRLKVQAALDDQELRTGSSTRVTYWEGAVEVSGVRGNRPLKGRGYLEMTGYAGGSMGDLFR